MKLKTNLDGQPVYVVDGCRTPFLKANGVGPFSASDLAVSAGRALLNRQPFSPADINDVILGCAMPGPTEANIARVVALRLGCGDRVPGHTVMRNCASGMQALDDAALRIASGRHDLVLAGGTEAMSHAPLLLNHKMADWLNAWFTSKHLKQRLALLPKLRPSFFVPVIALLKGLTDPIVSLNMGQTAEELAYRFHITRAQMDAFAASSHQRLAQAYETDHMSEVIPIIDNKGKVFTQDNGIRPDSTVEKLAKLRPFFDRKYGMVTAGNSSQITDGACMLLLASEKAVKEYNLPVLGRIVDSAWAALSPAQMGLGPVHAASAIMERHHLAPKDFGTWEINEAFAAQVLACLSAWDDADYAKEQLGLKSPLGAPSKDTLNQDGGAIAVGHPIGASGARIVLHTLQRMHRNNDKKGMAAICIGGGQGGAMYLDAQR